MSGRWSEFVSAGMGYVFAEEFEQLSYPRCRVVLKVGSRGGDGIGTA